jgi:hypothetical protein
MQAADPDQQWGRLATGPHHPHTDEVLARTLAAIHGFRQCTHLRTRPAQPAVARVPLRRVDCRRCCMTLLRPPASDADRCDWCGSHGVSTFVPIAYALGQLTCIGDACGPCAQAMSRRAP